MKLETRGQLESKIQLNREKIEQLTQKIERLERERELLQQKVERQQYTLDHSKKADISELGLI